MLDGVRAILVTHVHADHLDAARIAASGLPVWGPPEALTPLADAGVPSELLHPVADGDELEVAGFGVRAIAEWHASWVRELAPRVEVPARPQKVLSSCCVTCGEQCAHTVTSG